MEEESWCKEFSMNVPFHDQIKNSLNHPKILSEGHTKTENRIGKAKNFKS